LTRAAEEWTRSQKALFEHVKCFQLPEVSRTVRLLKEFENSPLAKQLKWAGEHTKEIQRAIQAVRSPWLNTQNVLQSIGGFAELQRIGIALRQQPSFSDQLADQLRAGLGDWRATLEWPRAIFEDVAARQTFYVERGLDPRLTDFPRAAFEEGAAQAGLTTEISSRVDQAGEDDEEAGFARNNAAHDRLQRFETSLRSFIDQVMTAAFGEHWIKQRVPGEIRQDWETKRERDRALGSRVWPLIAYADFTHYVTIITRRDNWDGVFKDVFHRQELVKESLQRLYPIRICTMHARTLAVDDELYLYVETKRILNAIGIPVP
jgi:hypothetical protein